jgi:dolichyl-phosphate beta-glucosyltransferase
MNKITTPVSIVIPFHNEGRKIFNTLTILGEFCHKYFEHYEIIFVDDGSKDQLFMQLINEIYGPCYRVLRTGRNRGKGNAVRQGMLTSSGDYRFFMDADLPYQVSCFLSAIKAFRMDNCDIIVGDRTLSESVNKTRPRLDRHIGGKLFRFVVSMLLDIDSRDTQCGFKGFTKKAAERLFRTTTIEGYAFDVELFLLARKFEFNICRIPVTSLHSNALSTHLLCSIPIIFRDLFVLSTRQRKLL